MIKHYYIIQLFEPYRLWHIKAEGYKAAATILARRERNKSLKVDVWQPTLLSDKDGRNWELLCVTSESLGSYAEEELSFKSKRNRYDNISMGFNSIRANALSFQITSLVQKDVAAIIKESKKHKFDCASSYGEACSCGAK